ncbi:MAG: hypothetical protein WB756_13390 [Xanthobacteraceae bacterium]|jgi:hypothetical protein
MRRLALLTLLLLMVGGTASAASVSGSGGALALAALVAEPSPLLPPGEKAVMARLLNGILTFAFPANRTISVKADKIVCRASNVDISFHSCALTFRSKTINLKGRRAHELFATVGEVGVPPDGAAGTMFEALSHLDCTINPHEIPQKAGGGASCSFDPGAN